MATLSTLRAYSEGRLTRRQALVAIRFEERDYPHLLRLLGEAGLPVYIHSQADEMAETFARLWREA